ncbi:zinc finger MYM-type protein 1-like [Camellia sinensis]|uniref:zinc finger MYM-type protein 1-like n=1 Tax=Camellia sinensis TaxID=4442 RepID=UPI0010367D17|nr:zinc finger MYM-type protein 1-like [Camellia sinensis]
MIFDEVAGGYFCIFVNESQDESKKEQMTLILRYVKNDGLLGERFFDIMGVENTSALTLKKEISNILSRFNLLIQNMGCQGYDGASNMRGEWNGLQPLFLKDCPYAYYVHCFAHRLQLALIAAAKDEPNVWQFFSHLSCTVNLVASSPKRLGELKSFHRSEVENMLASGERQFVVESLKKSTNQQIRRQANGVYKVMKSFEFIFVLYLMDNILRIVNTLCQVLQQKTQDILNAMKLVSTTKALIQKLRQDDWDIFLANVVSFCNRHNIAVHDMSSPYEEGTSRRHQQDYITIEHHYHFDIFNSTIDFQLIELEHRFNDGVVELLSLSSTLDPSGNLRSFNVDNICNLAEKFYSQDFTSQDIHALRCQLMHYKLDVVCDPEFHKISTLAELCRELFVTRKFEHYSMIYKLIRLMSTLPVSTATTERAFSSMKHVKIAIRNSMGDEFFANCLSLYLEQDLTLKIDLDSVIDEFESLKTHRAQLC